MTHRDSWILSIFPRLPNPREKYFNELSHYIDELSNNELKDAALMILGQKSVNEISVAANEIAQELLNWAERNTAKS